MTRLSEKIHVAPLDPSRLQRIENSVVGIPELTWEELREPPGWKRWMPAAAVACSLIIGTAALGSWWSRDATRVDLPRAAGAATAVVTGAGERSTIQVADGVVRVSEETRLTVQGMSDGAAEISLELGRIDCDVVPRTGRPAFWVLAGAVEVKVVGTAFSVARSGDEVEVEVSRGKVEIRKGHGAPI